MPRSHLCAATTLSAVLLFSPVLPPFAALAQMAHGHDGPWTTRAIAGYLDGKGCIVSKYSRLRAPPLIVARFSRTTLKETRGEMSRMSEAEVERLPNVSPVEMGKLLNMLLVAQRP
jgi:hypothetical protein